MLSTIHMTALPVQLMLQIVELVPQVMGFSLTLLYLCHQVLKLEGFELLSAP